MKTIYYSAASLDGYVADSGHSLDWLFAVPSDEESESFFPGFIANVGAFCMGSSTYEWILARENMLAEPEKWSRYHGDMPCWVFSGRPRAPIPGANIRFVSGAVADVHPAMRAAAGGKNVWISGGGDLAGQFFDAGLLDEIALSLAPVALGGGAPVLPRRIGADRLRLAEARPQWSFALLRFEVKAVGS